MALTAKSKVLACHNCLQKIISKAAVAQWIEYWPPKPRVVGSIPASRTTLSCSSSHRASAETELGKKSVQGVNVNYTGHFLRFRAGFELGQKL